jgi:hypothetical protein
MKQILPMLIGFVLLVPFAAVCATDPYQACIRLRKQTYNHRSSGRFEISCDTIGPIYGRFRIRLLS